MLQKQVTDTLQKVDSRPHVRLNLAILCTVALIEGADIQLLPSSFRALEANLALSPTRLALLTLLQGCAGACTGPLWASLADNGFSRRKLLSSSAAGWGILTLALANSRSFTTMAILRLLNGVALGMMLPVLQSLVADAADPSEIGFMFGSLQFYTNFGQVFGAVVVTSMSNRLYWGIEGWRIAFAAVGAISIVISLGVLTSLEEQPRPWRPQRIGLRQELRKFSSYMQIRSFVVVVAQGMFGTIPWAALSFTTMFFQYLGFSDTAASLVYGTSIAGTALGGVLGGMLGDRLEAWSPNHGRALVGQLTVMLGIPLVLTIFLRTPYNTPPIIFALLCFSLGLMCSWASSGCNRPIFVQIVPPASRASAMAWEVMLESSCGFLIGPSSVGYLAQHVFGYQMNTLQVGKMSIDARLANARALGHGMAVITAVPWVLCALCYTFLHKTLAEDVAKAKLKAADPCEMGLCATGVAIEEATPLLSNQRGRDAGYEHLNPAAPLESALPLPGTLLQSV